MGHWQYILYVNTTLFVLHCIISLCSFIIPVRIQSFSWANLIWGGHDLNIIFSGERKENEYLSYFVSTVMGSLRGGRMRCLQDRLRLDQTFNITVSPSWPVARGEEVQKRNPNKKNTAGTKICTTRPLTDCSLFWSFQMNNCDFASWIVYYFECNLKGSGPFFWM